MILAVASGKGGTGKTTLSANLARVMGQGVQLLDCDVEEPNAHLFLKGEITGSEVVGIEVPLIDESLCDGCGECSRFCQYHAIVSFGTKAMAFSEMCHGCGGCKMVCPRGAISYAEKRIGVVESIEAEGTELLHGRLDVGSPMAPPLIRAVKRRMKPGVTAIIDAPPGTSCPVIAAVRGADFVVLVTEPTPFGLNDLRLAVDMVRELAIPFGVVINRAGVGDDRVHAFCGDEGIPVLLEIPDDRRVAEAYSRGVLMVDAIHEYRALFESLMARVNLITKGGNRGD
ncbi:MAG TPA: ATP-binding protein [bacterium]|nr:ATP-binding protein [bacterium]